MRSRITSQLLRIFWETLNKLFYLNVVLHEQADLDRSARFHLGLIPGQIYRSPSSVLVLSGERGCYRGVVVPRWHREVGGAEDGWRRRRD